MRGLSALAAMALLAAATGALAQSGPVNHRGSAAGAPAQPPPAPDTMAPPPPQPIRVSPTPSDLAAQLSQIRATLRADLDQRRIGRRRAAHLRRELKTIELRAEALSVRAARIAASLP